VKQDLYKISLDTEAVDRFFVDVFLAAHPSAPEEIVLDLDATDDPLHGEQEGRFFHGYYGEYCYLPCIFFVALTCCTPSCWRRMSTPPTVPSLNSSASWRGFARVSPRCASSCGATQGLLAKSDELVRESRRGLCLGSGASLAKPWIEPSARR
jgi:Transposase DDE domain group 1